MRMISIFDLFRINSFKFDLNQSSNKFCSLPRPSPQVVDEYQIDLAIPFPEKGLLPVIHISLGHG